eukprot:g36140.t1
MLHPLCEKVAPHVPFKFFPSHLEPVLSSFGLPYPEKKTLATLRDWWALTSTCTMLISQTARSKYLLDVLNQNYHLLEHIKAVRRYLLLGQGDFVRHLMDLLKPELARSASTLYQHNLTGILETAVRATNAQFDSPEILKRLDVRLLE